MIPDNRVLLLLHFSNSSSNFFIRLSIISILFLIFIIFSGVISILKYFCNDSWHLIKLSCINVNFCFSSSTRVSDCLLSCNSCLILVISLVSRPFVCISWFKFLISLRNSFSSLSYFAIFILLLSINSWFLVVKSFILFVKSSFSNLNSFSNWLIVFSKLATCAFSVSIFSGVKFLLVYSINLFL